MTLITKTKTTEISQQSFCKNECLYQIITKYGVLRKKWAMFIYLFGLMLTF